MKPVNAPFLFSGFTLALLSVVLCLSADLSTEAQAQQPIPAACPFRGTDVIGASGTGPTLNDYYPDRLRVELLHNPAPAANPYGSTFDYAGAFSKLDYQQLKQDLTDFMTDSQSWWPADYGHYGPQVIRMAWHQAGTYRIADGRGGAGNAMQRLLPIASWEDNANTDKTRRLLWPIKQKYGELISWADLFQLAGNVALESMGTKLLGFAAGRLDIWEHDTSTFWGNELTKLARDDRWTGKPNDTNFELGDPLADSENMLIYVDPEGPGGNPDPIGSAREVRETFKRMAMDDEETVALIAGGHTFGKSHGNTKKDHIGPLPGNASIEEQGLGWHNFNGTGNAQYTTTNGIEGSWAQNPIQWDNNYFDNLLKLDFEVVMSPAGAHQWQPKTWGDNQTTPDADINGRQNPLMYFTSDVALKADPAFNKICQKFLNNHSAFQDAFAAAWYKLTHRDMGPKSRYIGPEIPPGDYIWQDPVPAVDHDLVNDDDVANLKSKLLDALPEKLGPMAYAYTAFSAASTHRHTDKRGGVNGARIRLDPQNQWGVNHPRQLGRVLSVLEQVKKDFDTDSKKVSIADLIVLAGNAAVEDAAKKANESLSMPFIPGRTDASAEQTDAESFEWLHPVMDGFRNFEKGHYKIKAENFLLDRAMLLNLTAPELTVLVGGMRALGLNYKKTKLGVFTDRPGTLSNDFFVNLLDMSTVWTPSKSDKDRFEGRDRTTGEHRYNATRVDLIFGHDHMLRSVAEVYASGASGQARMVKDFGAAWTKLMNADRYDKLTFSS